MTRNLKYVGLIAILPLIMIALATHHFDSADAEKSQGTPLLKTGSSGSPVCGDKLCSETGVQVKVPAPPAEKKPKAEEAKSMEEKKTMETMTPKKIFEENDLGSVLRLYKASVPATIPLHEGFYAGKSVYYIITDASEKKHADLITEQQGWKVELAPPLANAPQKALSKTYFFTNGVKGTGVHGFQGEVFTSTPTQADKYSALTSHVHVIWNENTTPKVLDSESAILKAESDGMVTLTSLSVVINMPQIVWPDGQMKVKEDKTITDETPYGGAQVLDIDLDAMTVTFVAHRGWGPDGSTIYYIVTDATPSGPADMMGVTPADSSASLIANSAAVDLFQFMNGIKGTGPLGFQAGIGATAAGDANYSPMWRIFMIGWKDPASASLLETIGDINMAKHEGLIDINIARPMDSDHIVNCPFIDPFQ